MALRILVVDDQEPVRRAITSILASRSDWDVCGEAADGLEAVARAKELRPDAILMDVSMPRMDGLQATREVRQHLPGAKIVIVSQNDPAVVRQQAAQVQADGYVGKDQLARHLIPSIAELFPEAISKAVDFSTGKPDEDVFAWLPGGEMGERIRSLDWSQTPLGPIEQWPQSLRTSVSICLASRFPIVMYWGPEYVVLYNDAYSSILGSKHPWALGQKCCDCWAEIWDTIGPMLDGVMTSGQATWSDDLLLLLQRRGYAEECYFSFSFSPIRVETGVVGGVFTAVIETTEKVVGERRLKTLRDLASRAVGAKTEAQVWRIATESLAEDLHDLPFSILSEFSGADQKVRILGTAGIDRDHPLCRALCTPGSALWQDLRSAVESRQAREARIANDLQAAPQGAWQIPPESLMILPIGETGSEKTASVLVAAVSPHKHLDDSYRIFFQLAANQLASAAADARSYEEERKRAEALAEIDRAKTLFFSNVSHEFRTPLTLMLGPLEDALAGSGLDEQQRNHLEVAHRNSLRLLKLVNTLLDFSRLEAGRIQACYEPTDLASLTADLASHFHSAVERAGLKLVVNCPVMKELAYVDHEMWEKIVFNLLSNAFKFTLQGEIEVSLIQETDSFELRVRDTGTGIPAEDLPHLFERFYRVQGARGRTWEGSGIGLALVQELVKLHGGTVRVESELNRGSTFIVTIPLGKAHLPAERIGAPRTLASTEVRAEAYVQEALHWTSGSQDISDEVEIASFVSAGAAAAPETKSQQVSRILLADDNADMRRYVEQLLNQRYEVVACRDGQAALEAARQLQPDLVLADVMMPRLDGFGLLRSLRQDEKLRSTPVILLSARAGEESRIEGLDAGADDYLVKPFSARELLARVNSQLNMARIRREAAEAERRLRAEAELERGRLEHEIADIKLLQGISAQMIYEDNVGSIYDKILDAAAAIMKSDFATMQSFYPERGARGELRLLAQRGLDPEAAKFWEWVRADSGCTCGEVLRSGKRAIAADVKSCEFMAGKPDQIELLKAGIHSAQSTPLLSRSGKLLGMISTHWRDPHQPSDRDLRLLDILTRQAADLLERSRAESVLRESEQRFRALVNATSDVVYRMSPDWTEMRELQGSGFLFDTGKPRKEWLEEYIHPDDRQFVLQKIREAVRTRSIFELEHRVRRKDGNLGWTYSRAIPLLDDRGEIVEWFGAATDVTARKDAQEKYRKLAETLDAEVRARTRDLEERNAEVLTQSEQVRELSWRLLRVQDMERRHIARELHDSAGQTLTVLGMNVAQFVQKTSRKAPELLSDAETIQETVQQLHRDIRTASYLLHPPLLDESGLYSALRWYTEGLVERSGLQVDFDMSEEFGRLPRDMELVIFRLVQECLTNIHRHSGSKTAMIHIIRDADQITVEISDQGKGMSAERLAEIHSGRSGVGIRGMRERLRQFKGEMKIESDNTGTRISVSVPLSKSVVGEDEPTAEPLPTAI